MKILKDRPVQTFRAQQEAEKNKVGIPAQYVEEQGRLPCGLREGRPGMEC